MTGLKLGSRDEHCGKPEEIASVRKEYLERTAWGIGWLTYSEAGVNTEIPAKLMGEKKVVWSEDLGRGFCQRSQ